MATRDNLKEAFAGESQANRTYLAFAKKAEEDRLPQVAKLFRAAAEAETIHAMRTNMLQTSKTNVRLVYSNNPRFSNA